MCQTLLIFFSSTVTFSYFVKKEKEKRLSAVFNELSIIPEKSTSVIPYHVCGGFCLNYFAIDACFLVIFAIDAYLFLLNIWVLRIFD